MSSEVLLKKFKHYSVFKIPGASTGISREEIEHRILKHSEFIQSIKKLMKLTKPKSQKFEKFRKEIQQARQKLRSLALQSGPSFLYKLVHHKTRASAIVLKLNRDAIAELIEMVRIRRSDQRTYLNPNHVTRFNAGDVSVNLIGMVHGKDAEIYDLYIQKKIGELDVPKKPKDNQGHVGIEFEFTSKVERTALGLMLFKAGLIRCCELKTDGSLRPHKNEYGYEIAILLKEKNFQKPLRILCEIFKKIDAQVEGRRCGLHVHLDVRRRRKEVVYYNLVSCQKLLMRMIPKDRRDGEFCSKVKSKQFPTNFTGDRKERYKSINAAAFYRHGTLEVRMHEGCTEFKDVRNWINLLIKIVSIRTRLPKSVASLGAFKKTIKVNEMLSIHIQDRINKWNILTPESSRLRPVSISWGDLGRRAASEVFSGANTSNSEPPGQPNLADPSLLPNDTAMGIIVDEMEAVPQTERR